LLEGSIAAAGRECLVQVRMNRPQRIVAAPRDRFILRSLSPMHTIGGGVIVEALTKKLRRKDEGVLQDAIERAKAVVIERDFVEYCIKSADAFAAGENELSIRSN